MRGKTICLVGLFILIQAAFGAPLFRFMEIEIPEGMQAYATAINEAGEVVGFMTDSEGRSKALHWKKGVTVLTGFEGEAEALAIDNSGRIVGRAKKNGVWTAWLYESGTNVDLDTGDTESAAVGINDQGQIIGNIVEPGNYENGFLLRPTKTILTCCTGGPDGGSSWRVRALNNGGQVVGDNFLTRDIQKPSDRIFLHPQTAETISLYKFGNGFGINTAGWIAGRFRYAISQYQAGIWREGNWIPLGAPTSVDSQANDINDRDEAVGFAGEFGMLWKERTGADLNTMAALPADFRITAGVGINNQGVVAVNLRANGKGRIGVLFPLFETLTLPAFRWVEPLNGAVQSDNFVVAKSAADLPDLPVDSVRYVLDRRSRRDAFGVPPSSWTPTAYHSAGFATNDARSRPYSATFENVPAGQYVLGAEVESGGMRLHLPPVSFAVTAPPTLLGYRVNFLGDFEFGLSGSPGLQYRLETSPDLTNWAVAELATEGGFFSRRSPQTNALFVRAVTIASGTNFFGRFAPNAPQAPQKLGNGELNFWSLDNQVQYNLNIENGVFNGSVPEVGSVEGTYTYAAEGSVGRFRAVDSREPEWMLDVMIESPFYNGPFTPTYFKGEVKLGEKTNILFGRLHR